jgi:DNA-binding protein H-NS
MNKNINYETLMAQISALTKQAEVLRNGEVSTVIEDIKAKMNDYGITITDLQFGEAKAETTEGGRVVHRRRKPEVKYMDATTGNAWTGRGKLPMWMKEAIGQGKTKDDFLVEGIFKAEEKPAAEAVAEAQSVEGKRTRRKPEAKYMDSITGNAWSGRGKTPVWLKQALAQGKTMENFAVA